VDETNIKARDRWMYLYRAVDSRGQTVDFLLLAKRDAAAAKRLTQGIGQLRIVIAISSAHANIIAFPPWRAGR
jgi:transposase, IS6 family